MHIQHIIDYYKHRLVQNLRDYQIAAGFDFSKLTLKSLAGQRRQLQWRLTTYLPSNSNHEP